MVAMINLNPRCLVRRISHRPLRQSLPLFLNYILSCLYVFISTPSTSMAMAASNTHGEEGLVPHSNLIAEWFGPFGASVAVLIVAVLFWNRQLRRSVSLRTYDLEKANRKLREHETKLQEAQHMAKLGYWCWDVATGDVEWSDEVYKIFRLDPSEFTPQIDSIMALSPWPEENQRHQELIQRVIGSHETDSYEQCFLCPDKTKGYYFSTFQGVYDADDKVVAIRGTIQDITERKLAELALRKNETELSAIYENVPLLMLLVDQDHKIIKMNNRALEKTQRSAEEVTGLGSGEALHCAYATESDKGCGLGAHCDSCEVRNVILEAFQTGQTINSREAAIPVATENGSVINYFQVSCKLLNQLDEDVVLVSLQDITDRKKAEIDLLNAKEYAEKILETSNAIVVGLDLNGNITTFNRAAERITGYKQCELKGKNWFEVLVPKDRYPYVWKEFTRLSAGGLPTMFENPILTKSGEERYISWQNSDTRNGGEVLGTISFGIDITERRQVEEERERLLSAIEQAAEIIMITDVNGTIEYVNPAFERITEYALDDVIGKHANILESDDHDKASYEEMWAALKQGSHWTGRVISKKKDGALFTEETTISPVFDSDGKAVNYVAVKRDVTEEIQLEEQLRQSQKMEAIGQLTGGVAHDFNNMLQVIESGTDLVLRDIEPDHRSRGLLEEVAKAGQRAATLVSQLLLFSRRKTMKPQIININDIVDDLIKMLRRIIGEDIRLNWEPDTNIKTIFADRSMIEQSLMNLCVNARDAMPTGGVLTIATHDTEVSKEDCKNHAWASPGQYVLMSVTDTGSGMDKETLTHIYEPFFTTKAAGKGTGLGLSTVYGIVRQHDGMIHVHSEPNTGTAFQLYWPTCERKKEQPVIKIPDPAQGGSETLLIAEDDEMVRRLTERYLTKAGYNVITASNGAEAVARFKERSADINMVILDVVMPEMGGRDAFEHMRALRPDLKALFASGYRDAAVEAETVLNEELKLINKPFTRNQLLHAIRNAMD